MRVCIDAGHGGIYPGAISPSGIQEKDINLSVATRVRDHLRRANVEVLMIRDTDQSLTPRERIQLANTSKADILVSIHHNSFTSPSAAGIETWFWHTCPNARALAEATQKRLSWLCALKDRGIKANAEFFMLKDTLMPAILTEGGFLSNPVEEALITNSVYQEKEAIAISLGILDYFARRK